MKRLALAALLVAAPAFAQTNEGIQRPQQQQQQVDATQLTKVPKQTKFVEAEYPKDAFEKNIETDVVLLLDIDAQGKISSVGIAEPSPHPDMGFEEAAMLAAQQFEFEPAEIAGQPTAVQITYKYKFRITKKPTDVPPPPAPADGTSAAPATPPPPARAPVANFTGALRERGTRTPMSGVLVTVFREQDGKPIGYEATSDAAGNFVFYDLGPGEWRVLIEAPGYFPFRTTEEIRTGEATGVTYYVERGSYNPFDVTVTATRPRKEVSRTVLSAKEIEKVPGAAGDPLAVVQNFAGVARVPQGGLIIVRGSAPEDTQTVVDGVTVPLIYHFGGLRSVVPAGMLDAIEFYPGNFSTQYGRATGGVIDVQIKQLKPQRVGGYVDVSLLDTGVYLEAPIGSKASVAVAARRSYIDGILNFAVPDDAPVSLVAAPRYYDYQFLANYRPAPAHDMRLLFFGSDDKLTLLFRNPADVDTSVDGNTLGTKTSFYRGLFTYRYVPGDRLENTFRLAAGRDQFFFGLGQFVFDLDFYTLQLRNNLRQKLSDRLQLTYGVDALVGRTSGLVRLPRPPKEGDPPQQFDLSQTVTSKIDGLNIYTPAAFVEAEWKPIDPLLVIPGVRVDWFERTETVLAQPRLTARLQLHPQVTFKAGAGLFAQEPDFEETDRFFGNPALKPERAWHYSAGVEWKPRENLTLDVTGFYKDLSSLVGKSDEVVMEGGTLRPLIYDNRAVGRVVGLELLARQEMTDKLSGWIAYTLSRSQRRDSGSAKYRLFDFDQTHILTALGTYQLPRNWLIGARYRLVSGNPRTPIIGSVFNASADRYDPVSGPVNSARNGMFHQLDVRVDKRWIYERWMLTLYLDIQNVYNRPNPEGLQYNYDFRLSDTQQGLPILTILGIRADF